MGTMSPINGLNFIMRVWALKKTTQIGWKRIALTLCSVSVCVWLVMWQTATAAGMGQWTVQWMREVRVAVGTIPFREVDRALWTLLWPRAASECGSTKSGRSLLFCVLCSSSLSLPWERLMKSGLDLWSASCQNQKHIGLLDKTFKSSSPISTFTFPQNITLGHPMKNSKVSPCVFPFCWHCSVFEWLQAWGWKIPKEF